MRTEFKMEHMPVSKLEIDLAKMLESKEGIDSFFASFCEWLNRHADMSRMAGAELVQVFYKNTLDKDKNPDGALSSIEIHAYKGMVPLFEFHKHFEPEEKSNIITLNGTNNDN